MAAGWRSSTRVAGLALAVAALGCASTPTAGTGRAAGEDTCFNSRRVESFSPLHGMYVYLRLTGGESYLLTLDGIYTSLPFATGIRLADNFSRVCSNTGATITFRDPSRPVVCRIIRVEKVASKEAATQLVKERTGSAPKP